MAVRGALIRVTLAALGALVALSTAAAAHGDGAKPRASVASTSKAAPKSIRGATARARAYTQYVRAWHTPIAARATPTDAAGRPMLALSSLNTNDRMEAIAASDRGGFSASDLDRAAHVLRDPSSGNQHPVEPRLLDLVYRLQSHFKAQEIRVVSGYRTSRRGASNHGHGRAIDLIVPGASDDEVAKFARELGYVGVGIYPSSGFVHVDVRARSYFWVDASAPGRRNRERGILADLAQRSDTQAAARGERAVSPFFIAPDVDAALRARGGAGGTGAAGAPTADEDDDLDGESEPANTDTSPSN